VILDMANDERVAITPAGLDRMMSAAWPTLEEVAVEGWSARFADGVTLRANSVLPLAPPEDLRSAIERVESLYLERSLRPAFQIGPAAQPPALEDVLSGHG
jgi:hypothetical protein